MWRGRERAYSSKSQSFTRRAGKRLKCWQQRLRQRVRDGLSTWSHTEKLKEWGEQGEGHKQAFSCLSATLTLRYVLFYILQFHFFFLWLKIGRLLQFSLQISGSTEAEEIPLSSAHHATSIQLAHIFFTSVTFMPSHWILFTVHFTLKSSSLNQV